MDRELIKACWRTLCLLAVVTVCYGADTIHRVSAQESRPTEYQVKAAYLYNFARFVEWPDTAFNGPQAPFILCILGEDPFGDAFDSVHGRTVKGRTFIAKKKRDLQEITSCH